MHPELLRDRLDALGLLTATLERAQPAGDWWTIVLTSDEVQAWLGVINDTRLVLGTRLNVTDDEVVIHPPESQASAHAMYDWLTWLQGDLIDVLLR